LNVTGAALVAAHTGSAASTAMDIHRKGIRASSTSLV
jgi:hypothetical protein